MEILQLTSQDFGLRPDMEKWTERLLEHGGAVPERKQPELQAVPCLMTSTVTRWETDLPRGQLISLAGFCPIC